MALPDATRSLLHRLEALRAARPPANTATRRKSRLLAAFLLVAVAVFGLLDIFYAFTRPGYTPPWYGYVFLLGC